MRDLPPHPRAAATDTHRQRPHEGAAGRSRESESVKALTGRCRTPRTREMQGMLDTSGLDRARAFAHVSNTSTLTQLPTAPRVGPARKRARLSRLPRCGPCARARVGARGAAPH
jgi:hypothetical protein